MADVMVRIRKELDARIEQLRPLAEEFERLQRAAAALARSGVRAVPGLGPGPSASRDPRPRRASALSAPNRPLNVARPCRLARLRPPRKLSIVAETNDGIATSHAIEVSNFDEPRLSLVAERYEGCPGT